MVLYSNTKHDYLWVIFKVVSLSTATWAQTRGRKGTQRSGERSVVQFFGYLTISARYRISCICVEKAIKVHNRSYVSCLCSQFFPQSQLIPHRKRKGNFFFKSRNMTSKECPSARCRVLPFHERDRRTGRHDDASSRLSRQIWRCDWKSVEFLQIAAWFIEKHRTFTVHDKSLCSARRLELQINSSLRSARKPSSNDMSSA